MLRQFRAKLLNRYKVRRMELCAWAFDGICSLLVDPPANKFMNSIVCSAMKMLSTSSKVVFMNCIITCKRRTCEEAHDMHSIFLHFCQTAKRSRKRKSSRLKTFMCMFMRHVSAAWWCAACLQVTRWFSLCINYYHYLQPRPQLLCNRFSLLLSFSSSSCGSILTTRTHINYSHSVEFTMWNEHVVLEKAIAIHWKRHVFHFIWRLRVPSTFMTSCICTPMNYLNFDVKRRNFIFVPCCLSVLGSCRKWICSIHTQQSALTRDSKNWCTWAWEMTCVYGPFNCVPFT